MKNEQLNKIGEIKKSKICCFDFILGSIIVLLISFLTVKYGNIHITDFKLDIILLPVIVTTTLVIHELIHIFCFLAFGQGKAKIKVVRDKKIRAIIMYQYNKDVFYKKTQTIIIMLAPLILVSMVSMVLLRYFPESFNIKANMILNVIGSLIDCGIVVRLLVTVPNNIKINYDYKSEEGVILNYYK